jgi:hypothetical protein
MLLGVLLAACGGGGGDGGQAAGPTLVAPPAAAATLAQSGSEASSAVQALHSGASAIVEKSTTLGSGGFVGPLSSAGAVNSTSPRPARSAQRERALAAQSFACTEMFPSPCSGSVTVDTNAPQSGTVVPAGTFFSITYQGLSFASGADTVQINGTFRVDFLTAFDTGATSPANLQMMLTLSDFSGNAGGVSFGPMNAIALVEYDASGVASLTVDGLRITDIDGAVVTDEDDYRIVGTRLRSAYWGSAAQYVDSDFSNWVVVGGRPTVGSTASIAAGTGSVTVAVTASSTSSVVYDVHLDRGGISVRYTVTATYSAGSSTPTYTAVVVG